MQSLQGGWATPCGGDLVERLQGAKRRQADLERQLSVPRVEPDREELRRSLVKLLDGWRGVLKQTDVGVRERC